ncbi:prolyl 4-hydroxylase subunit alpha-1-like [Clytia hemisphaerica]|uniref:procollagen-proline 4-dioxygenase n=1 Tax=Clytia hemisphaerica TaxID=252671 RepID=A0A7M5WJN4_9CNID
MNLTWMLTLQSVIFSTIILLETSGEYFSSSGHMRYLFDIEKQLASRLRTTIEREERRIAELKKFYNKIEHIEKKEDERNYIGHPNNAFKILRRLHRDWPKVQKVAERNHEEFSEFYAQYGNLLPSADDVDGARAALLRLQETFALSASQILNGIVPASNGFTKLSASDAYDIGRMAYTDKRYDVTIGWMKEALKLVDTSNHGDDLPSKVNILDHLAWSEYQINRMSDALNHTKQLLKLDPENDRIQRNKEAFENYLLEGVEAEGEKNLEERLAPHEFPHFYYTPDENDFERYHIERKLWQKLCRGETKPVPKRLTYKLVCWHKTDHPMLRIKPARLERIYPKPELIFYRQAMSDREIERVKTLAIDMLQRATVHNPSTGKLESADYRISKSAWLDESHDGIVDIMNRRIEAYTGLSMETAEKLQVANYGMGGHYETHFDFGRSVPLRPPPGKNRTDYTYRTHKGEDFKKDGHRIATFLAYMSNVEAGGATVFTNIGQAVQPAKGDAVFWFNLHHDGSGDFDTRHAACPVLIGEKWVSNRWIHERGQEFRRRCNLRPEDD